MIWEASPYEKYGGMEELVNPTFHRTIYAVSAINQWHETKGREVTNITTKGTIINLFWSWFKKINNKKAFLNN